MNNNNKERKETMEQQERGKIMKHMIEDGENYSRRKCKNCGKVTEMADHWWEFISTFCEPCTDLEFQAWNERRKARYVNPPEGEAY